MTIGLQDAKGLGRLLMEHTFSVPSHQRDYSWTEDEVRELLDDVTEAMGDPDSIHFVGLMVFMGSEQDTLMVLDGQQRLATTVMIYSAIRSWLLQYDEYRQDADDILRYYIGRRELGKKEIDPLLTLNVANAQSFNDYVINTVSPSDLDTKIKSLKKRDRDRRLIEATIYVRQRILQMTSERPRKEAAEQLFKVANYIRDRAAIVKLILPDEEMAYTVFETLNDRGLELSPLDLVKNHLFGRAASQSTNKIKMMEDRWAQMMLTLSNVRSDNFLKAYWTSRHGRIRTRKLFDAFKKQYPKATDANTLSIEMLEAAEQYAAIENADDPVWAAYSEKTRNFVRSLKIIGSQQAHPVILASLKKMPAGEVERLLRLVEVCTVRYLVIGGGATGRFETRCAVLAGKIFDGDVTTATAAYAELKEVFPSDTEFQQAFSTKDIDNNAKAQYVLRSLEIERRRKAGGEMPGELLPAPMTVEHILPQNPGKGWDDALKADPSVAEDCIYRLGNLCLLTEVNKKLGQKSFAEKKVVYKKSLLTITNELASHETWGGKRLKIGKRLWPRSPCRSGGFNDQWLNARFEGGYRSPTRRPRHRRAVRAHERMPRGQARLAGRGSCLRPYTLPL